MATPVPQDLFSRFQVGMFDERKIIGVPTAGQAFFGRPETGAITSYSPDANQVDIDIIRGDERVAALIPRGGVSRSLGSLQKNLRTEQFSSFSRKFPLAEEEGDVSADNLLNRVAGENPYVATTRMDRLRHHAVNIVHESMRRLIRMDEILAWQSIVTGKQDAIIGTANADLKYDFRRHADLTATTGTSWAGGAGAILADIDAGGQKLRSLGHVSPDMLILGDTAINSIIKDTSLRSLADNRRFSFMTMGDGAVMPGKFARFVAGGMTFQGTMRTPLGLELALFTYSEGYTASNGAFTKYIADDKAILCSSGARFDRYFGPPENLPDNPVRNMLYREYFGFDPSQPPMPPKIMAAGGVFAPEAFYHDAYISPDQKRLSIRTQHAPIFATTQTDSVYVLDTEP